MHVASGSELFVRKQSISLKSRREERIRGPCFWCFGEIQLGAEVKCRAVIIANNRPKAEVCLCCSQGMKRRETKVRPLSLSGPGVL